MKNIIQFLYNLNPTALILSNTAFIVLLGLVDFYTGIEFSFSIFYLLPISFTSWLGGKKAGLFAGILSSIVWFVADITGGHHYSSTIILIWNSFMRLTLFCMISIILSNFRENIVKRYQDELVNQKNKTIISTTQKITTLIAKNITVQNSEIIKWINHQKENGHRVSESLEKASHIIGSSLHILSEISFVDPYLGDSHADADKYLETLKTKLSMINDNFSESGKAGS